MVKTLYVDGLEGTEIRVNGDINSVEENIEIILKSDTEGRVTNGFNCNKKIGLIKEGGPCAAIFENLAGRKINT